jgi:hypothetical protein
MTKRPRLETPTALDLLTPARKTREKMQDEGGFNPMVLYAPRHGQPRLAVLTGEGRVHEPLAELLTDMRTQLGPAAWIAITVDSYARRDSFSGEIEPGVLATAFADGDPTVIEQMVVLLKRRNERVQVAAQTYRHLPSEGWEWDPPEVVSDHTGAVVDILNTYI